MTRLDIIATVLLAHLDEENEPDHESDHEPDEQVRGEAEQPDHEPDERQP